MKILIIGASGQVGKNILSMADAYQGFKFTGTSRKLSNGFLSLDLTDGESVKNVFKTIRPQITILCSAYTDVDGCEKEPRTARKINVEGTGLAARMCMEFGSKLVYLSTDYVFDGISGPYAETDVPNPLSVYGATKLEGEKIVLKQKDSLIIRTTGVYSYDAGGRNFIMQLVNSCHNGRKMTVPSDQYSNPTYAPELAGFVLDLISLEKHGIYNVAGRDFLSRYEFAVKACGIFGFDRGFITPAETSSMRQAAKRPLKGGLKTDKLLYEIGKIPQGAEAGLFGVVRSMAPQEPKIKKWTQ
ncbi:MAG: dTDP-4-dehydrorhamnose reductase [Elusimicrobia bacterium]|nr:dTDP-4-dehydrorhamnose reductase [Elusimicrobiota bacterium]